MTAEAYASTGEKVRGWIGVDLDGTLAHYETWIDGGGIGAPIPAMVDRVKAWLRQGIEVRIMTARVSDLGLVGKQLPIIVDWCKTHIGEELPVTCRKDFAMIELWDDRAVSVEANTGRAFRTGTELEGPA